MLLVVYVILLELKKVNC